LEETIQISHNWAIDRIHTLCQDDSRIDDAYALTKEFDEWLEPERDENDVLSLEFIGDDYV
tara:strand:+ start:176 stop:358 length:183 start_codon:yes stop_codon:yes gene_type:complete